MRRSTGEKSMNDITAISKAKHVTTEDGNGFEQRHEHGGSHVRTSLVADQSAIGFVDIVITTDEFKKIRKTTEGRLTLYPEQAKRLADELNSLAITAQQDRENPEYKPIQELPDPL